MKHITFHRPGTPTIRLALSYFSIILALSVGFSVAFYIASASNLQVRSGVPQAISKGTPNETIIGAADQNANPRTASLANAAEVDSQLWQRYAEIRAEIAHRLIILNIGVLIVGAGFSYCLARKTLRPIETAMEAQARFSSDASHELRTPLAALRAHGEVALREPHLSLTEAKAVIQTSIEQSIKLEQLSDGLLRLSQHDNNIAAVPVSLQEVASEAVDLVIASAQVKDIIIDDTVPAIMALGVTQNLVQVVTILLDNAIKYSRPGRTIHLEGQIEGKHVLLYVRDEGPGIAVKDLPHIFERFYRADSSRTKHGERGYGLGLSIAKKLVEQHNGKITVSSTLGKGTTFAVKLSTPRL